jgi:hypothetical protein
MTRYHATPEGPVPFTPEEEAEWDAIAATAEQRRTEAQSAEVRTERSRRLAACDWTQLPDAPVNAEAWAAYRQALRDVPDQAGFPWEVTWPEQP